MKFYMFLAILLLISGVAAAQSDSLPAGHGACCVENGVPTCSEISQDTCELIGGVHQGKGVLCVDAPSECQPSPTGAVPKTASEGSNRFGKCVDNPSEFASFEMAIDYTYDGDIIQERDIYPAIVTNNRAVASLRTRMCLPYYVRMRGVYEDGTKGDWTTGGTLHESTPDLNGDGTVADEDFSELATFWGAVYDGGDFLCLAREFNLQLSETADRELLTCP